MRRRSGEVGLGPACKSQPNMISRSRRKLWRHMAISKLPSNKAQGTRIKRQTPLSDSGGNELITSTETLRAISNNFRSRDGDEGEVARIALGKAAEVRASARRGDRKPSSPR